MASTPGSAFNEAGGRVRPRSARRTVPWGVGRAENQVLRDRTVFDRELPNDVKISSRPKPMSTSVGSDRRWRAPAEARTPDGVHERLSRLLVLDKPTVYGRPLPPRLTRPNAWFAADPPGTGAAQNTGERPQLGMSGKRRQRNDVHAPMRVRVPGRPSWLWPPPARRPSRSRLGTRRIDRSPEPARPDSPRCAAPWTRPPGSPFGLPPREDAPVTPGACPAPCRGCSIRPVAARA
jgi:hypothetical protein